MVTREEAVRTLQEGHTAIYDRLAKLSEEDLRRPGTIGEWSAGDLIGHLAFWEELALQAISAWQQSQMPKAEEFFRERSVDEANAEDVARKRERSLEEVRRAADETHRELLSGLAALSNEEWRSDPPYETDAPKQLGERLGGITGAPKKPFGHAFAHLDDLDVYLSSLAQGA